MKVTASEIEGSQVILDMEIEPERVEKAMERAYRRIVSQVNIPGFRRGKAPRVLVERVVGRETLMNEALEILVPEAYQEALRETGIDPVDTPKVDVISAEPLSVRATVAVRPKVKLGDYRAIRQSMDVAEVTAEQVGRALESVRQSRAQWVPIEREARQGDLLTLNIRGRVEARDRTFLDGRAQQVVLDPERPILTPGAVEQLIGLRSGERKAFDVTLPEDFQDEELAGQQASVEVEAIEVKEKQVPDLDDEFARSLGDYSSVEELRTAVRRELEERVLDQARRSTEESVLAAVVDQATAEPPRPWVEEQAESLIRGTREQISQQGLAFEQFLRESGQTEEGFKEEMMAAARRQLKRTLVLDAVAHAEGIDVDDREVDAELSRVLASRGARGGAVDEEKLRSNVRLQLRERKTIDRLVEIATGAEGEVEESGESEVAAAGEETLAAKSEAEEQG